MQKSIYKRPGIKMNIRVDNSSNYSEQQRILQTQISLQLEVFVEGLQCQV